MASQNLTEFDLHLRSILGLPIPEISYFGPAASAVILAAEVSQTFEFSGLEKALQIKGTEIRLFGKPTTRRHRRMGLALARGKTTEEARKKAFKAARLIKIQYK
jgi:phosphoribosylglycinamide formyltransferase 2